MGTVLFASTAEAQALGRAGLFEGECLPESMPACEVDSECEDGFACTAVGSEGAAQCLPVGHPELPLCVLRGMECPTRDGQPGEAVFGGRAGITFCIYPSDLELFCLSSADLATGASALGALTRCYLTPGGERATFENGDCDGDGVLNHMDLCCTEWDRAMHDAPPAVNPENGCGLGITTGTPGDLTCEPLPAARCRMGGTCDSPGDICTCIFGSSGPGSCEVYACIPRNPPDTYCVPTVPEGDPGDVCPDLADDPVSADPIRTASGELVLCSFEDELPSCTTSGGSDVADTIDCFRTLSGEVVPFSLGDCDRDGVANGDEDQEACICAAEADGCTNGCNMFLDPTCASPEEDAGPDTGSDAGTASEFDAGTVRYNGGGLGTCAVDPGARGRGGLALLASLTLLGLALVRRRR
jgi:hypothetical protein